MLPKTRFPLHVPAGIVLTLCAGSFSASAAESPTSFAVPLDPRTTWIEPEASSSLFPRPELGDFPATPDTVRLQVLEQDPGQARVAAFHLRGAHTGFAGVIEARREVDERSGLRRVTLSRVDADCLAEAERLKLQPQALCASVIARELMRGAQELTFRHPYLNHELTITMTQTDERGGTWSLVPMRRTGEPAVLQLELADDGDGMLTTRWRIADATERSSFRRELGAEIPLREFEASRFDSFELGLLSSLSFFDELTDLHRPWVAYSFETDLLEQPPAAGDEDIYGCEPVEGVCGAEYDTCVPTPDGWLGCNYDPRESGFGHGSRDDGGLGLGTGTGTGTVAGPDTWLYPDWQVGSFRTTPKFPRPLFQGLEPFVDASGQVTHYGLTYDMYSVLQIAATTPRVTPAAAMGQAIAAAHIAFVYMQWGNYHTGHNICGGYLFQTRLPGTIQPGDFASYVSTPQNPQFTCGRPDPGVYELNYVLDPHNLWDEGVAGEENNKGKFRGYHVETNP